MKHVTVEQVMMWLPCEPYTLEKVVELFDGRGSLSVVDILELNIPAKDMWLVVSHGEMIPLGVLHELACVCIEGDLMKVRAGGREPDVRILAGLEAKRSWMRGEITEEQMWLAGNNVWKAVRDESMFRKTRRPRKDVGRAVAWNANTTRYSNMRAIVESGCVGVKLVEILKGLLLTTEAQ